MSMTHGSGRPAAVDGASGMLQAMALATPGAPHPVTAAPRPAAPGCHWHARAENVARCACTIRSIVAAARAARLPLPAVDPVPLLEPARAVVGRAVGLVADRRALEPHRLGEHAARARPRSAPRRRAGAGGSAARGSMPAAKEDLGRVDVADAGHGPLVEQRHLHRAPRPAQPRGEVGPRDHEAVGAEPAGAAGGVEARGRRAAGSCRVRADPRSSSRRATAAPATVELQHEPHVLRRRRVDDEHQPRHPRLDRQPLACPPAPASRAPARPACRGGARAAIVRPREPPRDRVAAAGCDRRAAGRGCGETPAGAIRRPDQARDPAPHRLDFRQFWHRCSGRCRGW